MPYNHALSITKSIEFIKINFSTFLVAPLLIWVAPLLIWVVPLLIWVTPLLIWCKVRIKLNSASTEVGVEARAELGDKFLGSKNFGSKKIWGLKFFFESKKLSKKFFGSKKILG